MNTIQTQGIFIAWKKFQRRVEVLAPRLGLEIVYFHFDWEEKSKYHKALSYVLKTFGTLKCLFQKKPRLVFIQLPPPLVLYCAALYSRLTRSLYVADCHNSMVYGPWSKWLFVKKLLANGIMVVHNDHVAEHVEVNFWLTPFVLRTGIMEGRFVKDEYSILLKRLKLASQSYVILPWNIASDEPLEEVLDAARLLPEVRFVMTWYSERLSIALQKKLPPNLVLTGYLPTEDLNQIFAHAGVALVLTNREGTQLSGVHEAMAFEIPVVVSDLKTTRFLYKDAPVYVNNDPESIARGIQLAFETRIDLKEKLRMLRLETQNEFSEQIKNLKAILNLQAKERNYLYS